MEQFKSMRMFARYGRNGMKMMRIYSSMLRELCPRCLPLVAKSSGDLASVPSLCSIVCPQCQKMIERRTAEMDKLCGGKLGNFIKSQNNEKPVSSLGMLNPGLRESSADHD